MNRTSTPARWPQALAALALAGVFGQTSALAAVETYHLTGNYSDGASLSGTFDLDFSFDPTLAGDGGLDNAGIDLHNRFWVLQSVAMSFSDPSISLVPDTPFSKFIQIHYQTTDVSALDLRGNDGSVVSIYLTAAYTNVLNAVVLGSQFYTGGYSSSAADSVGNTFALSGISAPALAAAPVPEPEGYALMLAGLAAVGAAARRKAR